MGGGGSKSEDERWNSLKSALENSIFGQHIAVDELYKCLKEHYFNETPKKALVMICNGSLGTGKTYFATTVVKEIHDNGFQNPRVKLFVGPRDFPDPQQVIAYKEKLKADIESTVKKNPRAFFIFDEVDKMPLGTLDILSAYVDRHEIIEEIDYRKSVFLFLSNTGGERIDKIVLQQSMENKPRNQLLLHHFRRELKEIVFGEQGGLKDSTIISKSLIDHYVPFLPLERQHIVQCLQVEYDNIQDTFTKPVSLDEISNLFEYYPEKYPIFSQDGAKNVDVKINYAREFVNKGIPFPSAKSAIETGLASALDDISIN